MNDNFTEMNGYEIVMSVYDAPELIQYRAFRKYFDILPVLSSLAKNIRTMDKLCEGLGKCNLMKFEH